MPSDPAFDYRQLSIAERLELVEDLWDSIAQEAGTETLPLTEDEKVMLDERLAEHERNPRDVQSWDEVKARLHKRSR